MVFADTKTHGPLGRHTRGPRKCGCFPVRIPPRLGIRVPWLWQDPHTWFRLPSTLHLLSLPELECLCSDQPCPENIKKKKNIYIYIYSTPSSVPLALAFVMPSEHHLFLPSLVHSFSFGSELSYIKSLGIAWCGISTQRAFSSVQFSHSVVSNSLRPCELQHIRPPCPSPTPGVHPNSCPLSWWCHPAISSSVIPSPPTPNPSQHHSLFQWVNSSHEVAKVLEFQL